MLLANNCYSQVSFSQARQIFQTLEQTSGIRKPLYLSSSNKINAASSPFGVVINQGMLRFCKDKNELALVLGHELAHIANGDSYRKHRKQDEFNADRGGFVLANKAGYNSCSAINIFKRMGNKRSSTHPRSVQRYKALVRMCK